MTQAAGSRRGRSSGEARRVRSLPRAHRPIVAHTTPLPSHTYTRTVARPTARLLGRYSATRPLGAPPLATRPLGRGCGAAVDRRVQVWQCKARHLGLASPSDTAWSGPLLGPGLGTTAARSGGPTAGRSPGHGPRVPGWLPGSSPEPKAKRAVVVALSFSRSRHLASRTWEGTAATAADDATAAEVAGNAMERAQRQPFSGRTRRRA